MVTLPFGQTEVSEAELWDLIDIPTAVQQAKNGDVEDPEQRINRFVICLPLLLKWLEKNGRVYPWRQTTDPWKVYSAEILLQRTRGDAVEEVYPCFLERFPGPESLVAVSEDELRDMVRSLGFVNHRTRTLREVGDIFSKEFDGKVPESIEDMKKPWRVGNYSARACQVFSRGEPLALVDANFVRVFGRVLGYEMPRQPHKSEAVYDLLNALVPADPDLARAFNLAILDIGALVCTPNNPECESCPINSCCDYYQKKTDSNVNPAP